MEDRKVVSKKWRGLYTYMLIANVIYIVIFYIITQLYN